MRPDELRELRRDIRFYINESYRRHNPSLIYSSALEFGRCAVTLEHENSLRPAVMKFKAEMMAILLMNELGYRINSSTGNWMKVA